MAALAFLVFSATPFPEALATFASTVDLECPEGTLRLSTGTSAGDCFAEDGVRALCLDPSSNSAYARCKTGCLESHGTGSCSLGDEDPVGGSLVLRCDSGSRYLLRTQRGRGTCIAEETRSGWGARCTDTKDHAAEADCAHGCLSVRGKAMCAKYLAETSPPK